MLNHSVSAGCVALFWNTFYNARHARSPGRTAFESPMRLLSVGYRHSQELLGGNPGEQLQEDAEHGEERRKRFDPHGDLLEPSVGDVPELISLACPSCAASLEVDGGTRIIRCSYCGDDVYIPDTIWRKFHPGRRECSLRIWIDWPYILFEYRSIFRHIREFIPPWEVSGMTPDESPAVFFFL